MTLQQLLGRTLLAGFIVLTTCSSSLACVLNEETVRPQCQKEQLHYGICFSRDMDKAVRRSKSPAFRDSFNRVVEDARAYLNTIEPAANKLIITDLDETLVDNSGYYQVSKTFEPVSWQRWLNSNPEGPYHSNVLTLLKEAKQKGFSVMFITGRPVNQASATLEQVSDIPWDGVYFRPIGVTLTATQYKTRVRQALQDFGYEIVLNIGDQVSDLETPVDPGEGDFLLPNVMYNTP